MRPLMYILVLIAALVAVPIISNIVVAQSVPFDRNQCQQNCSWQMSSPSYGSYSNYYSCMKKCDTQAWKDIDRDTRDTERSR